jgi:hypothetical protein
MTLDAEVRFGDIAPEDFEPSCKTYLPRAGTAEQISNLTSDFQALLNLEHASLGAHSSNIRILNLKPIPKLVRARMIDDRDISL